MIVSKLTTLALALFSVGLSAQDAEADKRDAPRGASLPRLTDVGPVAPPEWKIIRPKRGTSSDSFSLKQPVHEFTVEDTILQASSRTAFMTYKGKGPFHNVVFRNSILMVEPGTIPLDRSLWAFRGYDMIDTLFERVEITGFGKITPKHDEGHGIYLNVAGSLTLDRCNIHHNGGQALQLVNRPNESSLPRGPAPGAIVIRNTSFRENGFNPNRGGFQVSIFGTGQTVLLEDVEIVAGMDKTEFPTGKTGGGLVIEAEPHDPRRNKTVWWRPLELPENFAMPFSQGRTELLRVRVNHRNPDKSLVQIKGCEELIVRGCEFRGGTIMLDHPKKPGRNCGRIVWEGNLGNATVVHAGKRLGKASEDFTIEP